MYEQAVQRERILLYAGKAVSLRILLKDKEIYIFDTRLFATQVLTTSTRFLAAQAAWHIIPFQYRNKPSKRFHDVLAFMTSLRSDEVADAKIGVAGFCWGGNHVTHLAHDKDLIDAAYSAHPSGLKVPDDFETVRVPYCMAIGDVDFALTGKELSRACEALKRSGVETESLIIPGAVHGFAVRADPNDKKQIANADQAEDMAVRWLGKYLSS